MVFFQNAHDGTSIGWCRAPEPGFPKAHSSPSVPLLSHLLNKMLDFPLKPPFQKKKCTAIQFWSTKGPNTTQHRDVAKADFDLITFLLTSLYTSRQLLCFYERCQGSETKETFAASGEVFNGWVDSATIWEGSASKSQGPPLPWHLRKRAGTWDSCCCDDDTCFFFFFS